MNDLYIDENGKKHRVGLPNVEAFLAKHPTAKLFVEEEIMGPEENPNVEGKPEVVATPVANAATKGTASQLENGFSGLTDYKGLTDEQKKQLNKQKKNKKTLKMGSSGSSGSSVDSNSVDSPKESRELIERWEKIEGLYSNPRKAVSSDNIEAYDLWKKTGKVDLNLIEGRRQDDVLYTEFNEKTSLSNEELEIINQPVDLNATLDDGSLKYKTEVELANTYLLNNKKNYTNEEVGTLAQKIISSNEKSKLSKDKTVEYLETIPSKERERLISYKVDEFSTIDKKYAKKQENFNLLLNTYFRSNEEGNPDNPDRVNLESIQSKFEDPDYKFDLEGLGSVDEIQDYKKQIESLGDPNKLTTQEAVDKYNVLIGKYNEAIKINKTVKLNNGKVVPTATYDLYKSLSSKEKEMQKVLKELNADLEKEPSEKASVKETLGLLKKNYNNASKRAAQAQLALGSTGWNLVGVVPRLITDYVESMMDTANSGVEALVKISTGLSVNVEDTQGTSKERLQNAPLFESLYSLSDFSADLVKKAETAYEEEFYDDVKFENAFDSLENFGEFFAQELVGQTGTIAAMAQGRLIGGITIGATSYEQQRRVLEEEAAKNILGTSDSTLEKAAVSAGYALAEVYLGLMPTMGIFNRGFSSALNSGKEALIRDGIGKFVAKGIIKPLAKDSTWEFLTEGATVGVQNVIDIIRGAKTPDQVLENVPQAAVTGGMLGTAFSAVPVAKGVIMRQLSNYNDFTGYRENLVRIAKLEDMLAKAPDKRYSEFRAIKKEAAELMQQNELILEKVESKINNQLTGEGFELFKAKTKQAEQLRVQALEIINAPETQLNKEAKKEALNILKKKFDQVQLSLTEFKKDYRVNIDLLSNSDRNKFIAKATLEFQNKGQQVSDLEVRDRAEKIWQEETFDENTKKDKSAVNTMREAGLDTTFKVFDDNSSAIQGVKDVLKKRVDSGQMTEAQAKAELELIIPKIKKGSLNGVTIDINKGFSDKLIFRENALKNGKTSTGVHEIGHDLFSLGISYNSDAFLPLAQTVMDWLAKNNESAYRRIQQRTRGQNVDEILTNFLEEIHSGRLDLEAKKNKGLLGYLSFGVTNAINVASEGKSNFNLKGDNDIITFMQTLSTKVKKGTLTVGDIKTLQENKLDEKKVNKKESSKLSETTIGEQLEAVLPEGMTNEEYKENGWKSVLAEVMTTDVLDGVIRNELKRRSIVTSGPDANVFGQPVEDFVEDVKGSTELQNTIKRWDGRGSIGGFIVTELQKFRIGDVSNKLKNKPQTQSIEGSIKAQNAIAEEDSSGGIVDDKLPKMPSETTKYQNALVDNLGIKESEINAALDEVIKEAYTDKKIVTFGDTRVLPKSVADFYGKMFGINPQTLTDKTRNFQKYDAEGLTRAKQYLIANAPADYSRLPKTKTDSNKGTFIPRKVTESLYTDGKLTGSLKDYMNLIKERPVKPIYRDKVSQTIRGLLGVNIRNRVFETVVPSQGQRLIGGAKFSLSTKQDIAFEENENVDTGHVTFEGEFEVGDTQFALKLIPLDNISDDFEAEFELKKQLEAKNIDTKELLSIEFEDFEDGLDVTGKSLEGKTSAIKTFSIVANSVLDFVKENNIKGVVFNSAEANRTRLYKAMVDRFSKELGWEYKQVKTTPVQGEVDTFVVTPEKTAKEQPTVKFSESLTANETLVLEALNQAKDINAAGVLSGIKGSITVSDLNRKNKQNQTLEAIERYGLTPNVFQSAMPASSGAVRAKLNQDNATSRKLALFLDKNNIKANKNTYYYALDNGDWIKSVKSKSGKSFYAPEGVVNLVASRGRLYYGVKDPAYVKALNAAKNNLKGKTELKPKKVNGKYFSNEAKEQSKINMEVLEDVVLQLERAVNEGVVIDDQVFKMDSSVAALLIAQGYQATGGIIKIAAGFKYESKNPEYGTSAKQRKGKKYREEHNPPASVVGANLIWAIVNNKVSIVMPKIKENYSQTLLSKADDQKLDAAKLDATLPKGTTILDNPVVRISAAGINLNSIVNVETGQTLAEENGIGVDAKIENNLEVYTKQNELILKLNSNKDFTKAEAKKQIDQFVKVAPSIAKASKSNNNKSAFKYSETPTNKVTIETAAKTDEALNIARDLNAPIKKIRVFDFDDTLAQTKSDVLYTMPDGTEGKLNAEQFANDGSTLLSEGAVFDFSEFNKVTEGKKGPLFKVAQTIAAKRGTEDVFVLTARAPESQLAIYEFLKSQGLDIPLKNITGLGNSTGDAKARWIVDKAADGYNDFYFADDAPQNVKAVKDALSVIDVKSKTQQAKIKFSETLDLDKDFNDIIENKTGIGSDKTYSRVKAQVAGASKGKFNFFIPPSAEDFVGLLYSTLGKGDVGDAQMAWYKSHLLNPFARAMENLANDRANIMQDFRGLKKSLGIVPKNLRKKIKDSNFTKEQAVRAYIWDKQGMEIPGISQKDQKYLVDFVNADAELVVFGDQLIEIGKGDAYAAPDAGWVAGNIGTDFIKALNTTKRSKYLETWQQNVDQIFSEANLNKLEAAYGANYREAMVDMLKRMRTGRNTSSGSDRLAARFTDWLTNSVGAIMFFNTRSAVLQTISAVNFINFSDNNVLKAGQAFANQPQYWSDFKKLFNSPFLLDRRSGLKLNVNEADIAAMAKGPGNGARNVIAGILKAGFLPTQLADSFAIASGGASFYRNRIKALQKEGLTEAEAEEQAFRDFREIAEESQQSSRPDKISQQQAGPLGRVVLAFANTPAQYARLIKKAASDLKNGRGDAKTNISKIIYYGVAQNLLFSALQSALFAIAFDDEEEEEKKNEKYFEVVNKMSDGILRGIGVGGAIVSVVKNTAIRLAKEAEKKSPKYQDAVVKEVLQISPPISSKVSKLQSAGRSFSWNQEEMRTRGWSIDNPAYLASANVISAATNVPLDRAVKKITNIVDASNENIEYYKRIALVLGWSAWELGIDKEGGKVTPPKTDMDKLYDLTKKQQIDSLTSLGISKKQIKLLKLEEDRVNAILNPKSIKQIKVSKKDSLFGLNKKDQIQALERLGLTKKEIRALRLESDRVEAIINKQKQEN